LTVTSTSSELASGLLALRFQASYHGLWLRGAGETGRITHVIYFFQQGGLLYEFDYSSITPWAAELLPVFNASAKSIRFAAAYA
jgi:hypothetical protein